MKESWGPLLGFVLIVIVFCYVESRDDGGRILAKAFGWGCILISAVGFATGQLVQKSGSVGVVAGPLGYLGAVIMLVIGVYIIRNYNKDQ